MLEQQVVFNGLLNEVWCGFRGSCEWSMNLRSRLLFFDLRGNWTGLGFVEHEPPSWTSFDP
jgi:hypothetical protein